MSQPPRRLSLDDVGARRPMQARPSGGPPPRPWRPVATQALIGLNAFVFVLQLLWGGTSSVPMMVVMGAMAGQLVAEGEVWRLASATVLHGSLMHIALNCYVLYILGSFTERVLGTGRFLVLYIVSGIVASIGSALFTNAVSVGASGAVFGLLAAQGVLAYFPRGLLPPAMIPGARKAALVNLLLNIGISFLPQIDLAAHFTGAAAGALLVFSGVVVPKVTDPPAQQRHSLARWFLGGATLAVVYASIALYGVLQAAPWQYAS